MNLSASQAVRIRTVLTITLGVAEIAIRLRLLLQALLESVKILLTSILLKGLRMLTGVIILLVAMPLFVMTAPLVVLPPRARRAAARNCFRSDRSFSRHRATHEVRAIVDLGGTMLVVLLVVVSPLVVAMVAVHSWVIPMPLAFEAVQTDFRNPQAWEANPTRGPYESIARRHEHFVLSRGGTLEDARSIQRTLWRSAPFVAMLWVATMFVLAGWICRLSRSAFCEYHAGLRTRTLILSNKRYAVALCKQPNVAARRRYLTGSRDATS